MILRSNHFFYPCYRDLLLVLGETDMLSKIRARNQLSVGFCLKMLSFFLGGLHFFSYSIAMFRFHFPFPILGSNFKETLWRRITIEKIYVKFGQKECCSLNFVVFISNWPLKLVLGFNVVIQLKYVIIIIIIFHTRSPM